MSVEERLRRFMIEELQAREETVTPDYPLIGQQVLDSLGILQVVSFLESEFDVEVEDDELVADNFVSIAAITKLVESKLG